MKTIQNDLFLLRKQPIIQSPAYSWVTKVIVLGCLFCRTQTTYAASSIFSPVANGSVGAYQNTLTSSVEVAGGPYPLQGVLEFSSLNPAPYSSIQLQLSPAARPLYVDMIYVYGYDNADGLLTSADFNAGTYLGTLHVPSDLAFHQYVSFDVTSFVESLGGSFFGFNLRTDETGGVDAFTTTGNSYGTPPELVAVPEPNCVGLVALFVAASTAPLKRKECKSVTKAGPWTQSLSS
jgi:hypothetical protein